MLGGAAGNFRAHWIVGDLVDEEAQSDLRGIFRNISPKPIIHCTHPESEFYKRRIIQVNISRSLVKKQKRDVVSKEDWWNGSFDCGATDE